MSVASSLTIIAMSWFRLCEFYPTCLVCVRFRRLCACVYDGISRRKEGLEKEQYCSDQVGDSRESEKVVLSQREKFDERIRPGPFFVVVVRL